MSDNWTWLDIDKRMVTVAQRAGKEVIQYNITLSKEAYEHFIDPDCCCGMIVVSRGGTGCAGTIIVTGADDCPVHGFGETHEGEPV